MSARLFFALVLLNLPGCVRIAGEPTAFECAGDADCPSGTLCRHTGSVAGTCRAADYCTFETDCPDKQACFESRCQEVECTNEAQCGDYQCNRTTYTCFDSCEVWGQCASGRVCSVAGKCITPQCESAADCNGYQCNTYECLTSCTQDADCAQYWTCKAGVCANLQKDDGETCLDNTSCKSLNCCPSGICAADCAAVKCAGTSTPCEARDDASCGEGYGCAIGYSCTGGTTDCTVLSGVCPFGCDYDFATDECTGQFDCSYGYSEYSCQSAIDSGANCAWEAGHCEGTPEPCSQVSLLSCAEHPGCHVELAP